MSEFLIILAIVGVGSLMFVTFIAGVIGQFGFPLPPNERRLGCIDGLRGYLAICVLIHHFFIWIQLTRLGRTWQNSSINFIDQLGIGSVALFFMTTGLVFYPRVLAGIQDTSWVAVYVTRIFRIMPLVVLSVGIVTAIISARTGAIPDRHYIMAVARWISTWSEVPLLGYPDSGRLNAYVLWSLWYEWLFYICVLPACAFAMDWVRAREMPTWIVPAALFGTGMVARSIGLLMDHTVGILFYLPVFAIGMLAFELRSIRYVRDVLSERWVAIVAIIALLIGMVTTGDPFTLSLPLFSFFFICVASGNDLFGMLVRRGALVLGECSFGIYLLHGIVLYVIFVGARTFYSDWNLATLPVLLAVAVVAIGMITPITYLLIERPSIRLGRLLSRWLEGSRLKLGSRELEIAP